jgi:hypothetical protein
MKDTGTMTCSKQSVRAVVTQLRSVASYLEDLLPDEMEAGLSATEKASYIVRGLDWPAKKQKTAKKGGA